MFKLLLLGLATTVQSMQDTLQPSSALPTAAVTNTCSAPRYYSVEVQVDVEDMKYSAKFSNGKIKTTTCEKKETTDGKIKTVCNSNDEKIEFHEYKYSKKTKKTVFNAFGKLRICQPRKIKDIEMTKIKDIEMTFEVAIRKDSILNIRKMSAEKWRIKIDENALDGAKIFVFATKSKFNPEFNKNEYPKEIPEVSAIDVAKKIVASVKPDKTRGEYKREDEETWPTYSVTVKVFDYERIDDALTRLTESMAKLAKKHAVLDAELDKCRHDKPNSNAS